MKGKKSFAVSIFLGCLLIAVFVIGMIYVRNPASLIRSNRYDFAWEQFVSFCGNVWLPAGIIGIPLLLVSLILSLRQESRDHNRN